MMKLRRDVPVDVTVDAWSPRPDLSALSRLFDFLEFKTMLKRVTEIAENQKWETRGAVAASQASTTQVAVRDIRHVESLDEFVEIFSSDGEKCVSAILDTTQGIGVMEARLEGLAVTLDDWDGSVAYIPHTVLSSDRATSALSSARNLVMHDAKPYLNALAQMGIDVRGLVLDTSIAAYLINPSRSGYSLRDVCQDLLGDVPGELQADDGQFDFGGQADDDKIRHACEEVVFVRALSRVVRQRLHDIGNDALYFDIENPLIRVLSKMESKGIAVDKKRTD
jgi:DNA polymerase-1